MSSFFVSYSCIDSLIINYCHDNFNKPQGQVKRMTFIKLYVIIACGLFILFIREMSGCFMKFFAAPSKIFSFFLLYNLTTTLINFWSNHFVQIHWILKSIKRTLQSYEQSLIQGICFLGWAWFEQNCLCELETWAWVESCNRTL